MKHSVENKGNFAILHLAGEVDMNNSAGARDAMLGCLAQKRHLIVDMHEVEYIDSSGIASLVEAFQESRKRGTRFSLVAVSPPALRVFELARLDKVFTIHARLEDALADGA